MDFSPSGLRLRTLRKAKNLTQAQLAEKLELSVNYYSAIERGAKIPQLDTFVRIVNELGASADDVLSAQLRCGVVAQTSRLSADLANLPRDDQAYIMAAIDALISTAKKNHTST